MINATILILKIVNFPHFDEDIPRFPSYGVYISQLSRFARVCSNFDDFKNRNIFWTSKLLINGWRYQKLRAAFFLNFITDTLG